MDFQNGIKNQWGGRPYLDLVKGFEYIEKNLPYVDTSRAVALGASYGGYMVNVRVFFNPLLLFGLLFFHTNELFSGSKATLSVANSKL